MKNHSVRKLLGCVFALAALGFCPGRAAAAGQGSFFHLQIGGQWGYGGFNASDLGVYRAMNNAQAYAFPSVRLWRFEFGPLVNYKLVGQLTDPTKIDGTNLRGSGYDVGVGVGFFLSNRVHALFSTPLVASYAIATADGNGNMTTMTNPIGGKATISIRMTSRIYLDLFAEWIEYTSFSSGGTTGLFSTNPVLWNGGAGLSILF